MIPFLSKVPADLDVFRPEQEKLVKHFLPFSANSSRVSDNLKMSLIIEALLMNMWTAESLWSGKALSDAVQKGIRARAQKCRYSTKTKEEKEHQKLLSMSGERIELILTTLEMVNEPMKSFGGLDGTDETPLSTLDTDLVDDLVKEHGDKLSELSDLDFDMVDPNDDIAIGPEGVLSGSLSSSLVFTPESSAKSPARSVSPDCTTEKEWEPRRGPPRVILNLNKTGERQFLRDLH